MASLSPFAAAHPVSDACGSIFRYYHVGHSGSYWTFFIAAGDGGCSCIRRRQFFKLGPTHLKREPRVLRGLTRVQA